MKTFHTSAGSFEVIRALGQGTSGKVWLVFDPRLKKEVAYKELRFAGLQASFINQLKSEFEILTKLHASGLARVYHFGYCEESKNYFFTSDYIEGCPLENALEGKPLPFITAVFEQILQMLSYLHTHGVVHLDLKNSNILVREIDEKPHVSLLDFGVAQVLKRGFPKQKMGTPATMSPEMVRGEAVDERADLYAVGILLYRTLMKTWPFPTDGVDNVYRWHREGLLPPPFFTSVLPDYLKNIIIQLLKKDPADRFKSARAVLNVMQAVVTPQAQTSFPSALPFVERDELMGLLEKNIVSLKNKTPSFVKVSGAFGVGKTRWLAECSYQLELNDVRVVLVKGKESASAFTQIERALSIQHETLSDIQTISQKINVIEEKLGQGMVALLVDDIDLTDLAFREWIKKLKERMAHYERLSQPFPLMVLVTLGTEDASFSLNPLSEQAINFCLKPYLKENILKQFSALLYNWSGGVPFWVYQGLQAYWEILLKGDVPQKIELPQNQTDFYKKNIQLLGHEPTQIMAVLALFNRALPVTLIGKILKLDDAVCRESLEFLVRQQLVVEVEGYYKIISRVVTRNFYENSSQAFFKEIAKASLKESDQLVGSDLPFLHEQAGDKETAATLYFSMGSQQKDEQHFIEGLSSFLKACELTRDLSLKEKACLEMARLHLILANTDECEKILGHIKPTTTSPLYFELWGWLSLRLAKIEEAKKYFEKAFHLLPPDNVYWKIRLLNALAQIEFTHKNYLKAISLYEESDRLELSYQATGKRRDTNNQLALAYAANREVEKAILYLQHKIKSQTYDERQLIPLLGQQGYIYLTAGQYRFACEVLEKATAMAKQTRYFDQFLINLGNLFLAYQKQFLYGKALKVIHQSLEHGRLYGKNLSYYYLQEASLYLNLRQKEACLRAVKDGRSFATEMGTSHLVNWFDLMEAYLEKEMGDIKKGILLFEKIEDAAVLPWAKLGLAECYVKDKPEIAKKYLGQSVGLEDRDFLQKKKFLALQLATFNSEAWLLLIEDCQHDNLELFFEIVASYLKLSNNQAINDSLIQKYQKLLAGILQNIPQEFHMAYLQNKLKLSSPPKETSMQDNQLKQILALNKKLGEVESPENILKIILDEAIGLALAEEGLVLKGDGENGLKVVVARNMEGADISKIQYSQSLAKKVLMTGRSLFSQNASVDTALNIFESVVAQNLKSVFCIPLKVHNEPIGIIYLASTQVNEGMNEDFLPLLETFAEQASLVLSKAMDVQAKDESLRQAVSDLKEREAEIANLTTLVGKKTRDTQYAYDKIIGKSKKIEDVLKVMDKITNAKVPVFIFGESGTGKEQIAKSLHYNSFRKDKSFVAVNCSAFSENILESELFGYYKGVFTGADRDRAGLFETASGGTIFLDEVGDMSLSMQAKILRAIQEQEIMRVGGREPIKINVRVVSASNKDLRQMSKEGGFREDLYFRLAGITLNLPALRERREDIPLLIKHFIVKICDENKVKEKISLSKDAYQYLLGYSWPGNIRELEQALTAAVLMCDKGMIKKDHLLLQGASFQSVSGGEVLSSGEVILFSPQKSLADYEKEIILKAYEYCHQNKSQTAKLLGVSRLTLYKKIEMYGM